MKQAKVINLDPSFPQEAQLRSAAKVILKGGLVIIPTETVYGVACAMDNKKAIAKLYEIKQRPKDKPFALLIDRKERVEELASCVPVSAWKLINKFWPGALTIILKSKESGTLGLRMPDNEIALRIIAYADMPLACPSANISGKPAPVNAEDAARDLGQVVDLVINAGQTRLCVESTIVDLSGKHPEILREGYIRKEEINKALDKKTVLFVCTGNSCRSVMAEALLKKKLRENQRNNVEVISAGIMMMAGIGATSSTREVLRQEGIDVSGHHSQRVTKDMIQRSDLVLVMEKVHEEKVLQLEPDAKNRVFLLKEFAKINDGESGLSIEDPIGKPLDFYENTVKIIKEAVERIAEII